MPFQERDSLGCLLELTWNGQKEIPVGNLTRKFLEDGDEVILTGCCKVLWVRSFLINSDLGLYGDARLYFDSTIRWFFRVKATTLVLEPAPGRFCRHFPEPTRLYISSRVQTLNNLARCYVTEQRGLFSHRKLILCCGIKSVHHFIHIFSLKNCVIKLVKMQCLSSLHPSPSEIWILWVSVYMGLAAH